LIIVVGEKKVERKCRIYKIKTMEQKKKPTAAAAAT
jgi:hypothetical protein